MQTKTKTKRISNPGHRLETARQALSLTRLDISKRVGLDVRAIKLIDSWAINDLKISNRQLRQVLKDYALLVNLRPSEIINQVDFERPKQTTNKPLIIISHKLILFISLLVALSSIGFIVWRSYSATSAPQLVLYAPNDQEIVNDVRVEVRGKTSEQTQVFINSSAVLINPDGTFSADFILQPGQNKLVLTAVNTFGKSTTITRTIIYTP